MKALETMKLSLPVFATALVLSLLHSSTSAAETQAPSVALNSPGAQELMAEEVESWSRSLETHRLSIRYQQQMNGGIVLRGVPSGAQKFNRGKLISCSPKAVGGTFAAARKSCDVNNVRYFPISTPGQDQVTAVPAGTYILGFENTMSNGFVVIRPGQVTTIDLQRIQIPSGGQVKIYRDMTSLLEQSKMYFSTYGMNESLFSLAKWDFGDLYLRPNGIENGMKLFDYSFCEGRLPEVTTKGKRVCRAWNQGSFMSIMEMFNFEPYTARDKNKNVYVVQSSIGAFTQYSMEFPGRPVPYRMGRQLVSVPTTSNEVSHVNVLPGKYVIEVTAANGTSQLSKVSVGDLSTNMGWLPAPQALKLDGQTVSASPITDVDGNIVSTSGLSPESEEGDYVNPKETCTSASMWRTEKRAYCVSNSSEGCDRRTALMCEPMFNIP